MIWPGMADAHNSLGMAQHDLNRLAEAENSFRGAVRLQPELAAAWVNLGLVRQKFGALAEAESCYRQALDAGADPEDVCGNLGMVLLEQGRPAEAEAACREALAGDPENPGLQVNLALALLLMGQMQEGWAAYEARSAVDPMPAPPLSVPFWTGEQPLAGRTLLVRAEQGFGDTIQFCRYAPLLARDGARVVLEVQPQLVRLLSTLSDGVEVIAQGEALPECDFHCLMMSLPFLCGTTLESIPAEIPYLRADEALRAAWREPLQAHDGLRVGLVWGGGTRPERAHASAIDRRRSVPPGVMAPLATVAGCQFISLQVGPKSGLAEQLPEDMILLDPTASLADFADTAALVSELDLVIAVDTAVAHLAGAIGTEVWLLNRFDSCWRWLQDRDDSPWYPGMRLFRQTAPGDWAEVMDRVVAALAERVRAHEDRSA